MQAKPVELPLIECSVTFLTPEEGGRATPFPLGALSGNGYRPHLVVDEKSSLNATGDGWDGEDYIGVAFNSGPEHPLAGSAMTVRLTATYFPHSMYDALRPGVTFTVREGRQVVGFGSVRRWIR